MAKGPVQKGRDVRPAKTAASTKGTTPTKASAELKAEYQAALAWDRDHPVKQGCFN